MAKYLTDAWRKNISDSIRTHGKTGSKIYFVWVHMKQRCFDKNQPEVYARYGGRGITVCKRWMNFNNFYADMGDIPKGKTLDRTNNNGNYEPSNCRWATWKEQQNNRENGIRLSYKGKTRTLLEWAEELKVKPVTLYRRYYTWNDTNRMFEQPFRKSPVFSVKKRASLRTAF